MIWGTGLFVVNENSPSLPVSPQTVQEGPTRRPDAPWSHRSSILVEPQIVDPDDERNQLHPACHLQ